MIYKTSDERENATVKQTHFSRKQRNSISKKNGKKLNHQKKIEKHFILDLEGHLNLLFFFHIVGTRDMTLHL